MPEGDTIWRVAARLRPALLGRVVRRFDAPRLVGPRPRAGADDVGATVVAVDAVGKHLLITFDDGVQLQTHLRMTGSWHLYRTGERWQRPAHLARVTIAVDDWVAVCFAAPVVRTARVARAIPTAPPPATLPATATAAPPAAPTARPPSNPINPTVEPPAPRSPAVAHLGPDLTAEAVDLDAVLARLSRQDPARPLVDVLLDQRIAAGIGNVYKSELLWRHRLHPSTPVGTLAADARRALYTDAHRLLRANLGPGPRTTAPGVPGGLAVYRRRGRGCPRCGTPVERAELGRPPRSTYWCRVCQPLL